MDKEDLKIYESPAVIKHLEIIQGIVDRMASNSAACKTWAITIITGLIVFSIDSQTIPIWTSLIPAIVFFALDAFYLGQERHYIKLYKEFVSRLADNTIKIHDIYTVKSERNFFKHVGYVLSGMVSFPTSFYYMPIIILVICLWTIGL